MALVAATSTVERPRTTSGRSRRPRRLRIAFVVHDYNRVLGHSRYVVELAERFAADHDVHVFANRFERLPATIVGHRVPAVRRSALLSIFSFYVPASLMVRGSSTSFMPRVSPSMLPDIVTAHISNARWLEGRRLLEARSCPEGAGCSGPRHSSRAPGVEGPTAPP